MMYGSFSLEILGPRTAERSEAKLFFSDGPETRDTL